MFVVKPVLKSMVVEDIQTTVDMDLIKDNCQMS